MKISYKWLREYVNTKIEARKLLNILTMAGLEVTSHKKIDRDDIFEIEVTPNRPDWLSHIGVAREVAALQGKTLKLPEVSVKQELESSVNVTIKDIKSCLFYSVRVIYNVKIGPSPKWLQKKIEAVGLRSINNVVDITNFVMMETGQPLHVFDMGKVEGKEIIVRNAERGEKLLLIDETEKDLTERNLVIADAKKPLALAGIMGGKTSEVGIETKDILLECALFNPYSIRKTVQELGAASESSYRFERGVDTGRILYASDRAASLIADIAKGKIGARKNTGYVENKMFSVLLECAKVNEVLGTTLSSADIRRILKGLGFDVRGSSLLEVKAPSYRIDIEKREDLIEEIARIYGYSKIPLAMPEIVVTDEKPYIKEDRDKTDIIKSILTSAGYCETITYSLISRDLVKKTRISEQGLISIRNPLSKEQEVMRNSLLPGALKVVSYNISRQINSVKIFELSKIYFERDSLYNEDVSLCITDYKKRGKVQSHSNAIYSIKGAIETLIKNMGIGQIQFEKSDHPLFVRGETLAVLSDKHMLGIIGTVNSDILDAFDISGDTAIADINFKELRTIADLKKQFVRLPRYPYSYRDISFSSADTVLYKDIVSLIKKKGGALIEDIEFLSEYRGRGVEIRERSLALRIIYRAKDKTLTDEEVDSVNKSVRDGIVECFSATLR